MRAQTVFSIAFCALAFVSAAAPSARADSASELYYERAVMSAAGARCGLFSPEIAAALAASQIQARNTALRAGLPSGDLDAALGRANARAAAALCQGQDVKLAADRVRQAFKAYAGLRAMTFPGDQGDWRASRDETQIYNAWRLTQAAHTGADRAMFGLAGRQGRDSLVAAAAFADGATPYAARLVLRDRTRAPTAYIADLSGKAPLQSRVPPPTATYTILAEARGPGEPALLPPGTHVGTVFRFPASAVTALSALDPREAIRVDFVFAGSGGDMVRRSYFEVGDFSAGLAFLRAGQR